MIFSSCVRAARIGGLLAFLQEVVKFLVFILCVVEWSQISEIEVQVLDSGFNLEFLGSLWALDVVYLPLRI